MDADAEVDAEATGPLLAATEADADAEADALAKGTSTAFGRSCPALS